MEPCKKTILIVDDEVLCLDILNETLEDDYQLIFAKGGEECLSSVMNNKKPDLIILDIMMPGIDGYEVCKILKSDPETANIPIIFISAESDEGNQEKGFAYGAVDYISKPFGSAIVKARVKTHLALYDQNQFLECALAKRELEIKENYQEIRQLAAAVKHSPTSIVTTNARGVIQYVNPEFTKCTGYSQQEVNGKSFFFLMVNQELNPQTEILASIMAGQIWKGELLIRSKDNKHYYESTSIAPIKNNGDEIKGYVAVMEDITEQKMMTDKLQFALDSIRVLNKTLLATLVVSSKKELFEALIEQLPSFEFMSIANKIAIFNVGVDDSLHLFKTSNLQENEVELLKKEKDPEYCRKPIFASNQVVFLDREKCNYCIECAVCGDRYMVPIKVGNRAHFLVLFYFLSENGPDQDSVHFLNILAEALANVLKVLLAQVQMVQSEKNAALGSIVAGVAHEINTPLGIAVTGASDLIDKGDAFETLYSSEGISELELLEFTGSVQRISELIQKNLTRAADLIRSFKQVTVDQASLKKRRFSFKQNMVDTLITMHHMLKRSKVKIDFDCPDDLIIRSVPGNYSQIITNCITNSLTHGFDQDEEGQITINVTTEKTNLILLYKDNGKGMDEDTLNHIFDPFFTTKRDSGGSGLGMHIIHNLVTDMKGTVSALSAINEGFTLNMKLPIELK